MLEQTSQEVFNRFNKNVEDEFTVLDAGCGVGATIDTGVRRFSLAQFTGISVVPWQIEQAKERNMARSLMSLGMLFGTSLGKLSIWNYRGDQRVEVWLRRELGLRSKRYAR